MRICFSRNARSYRLCDFPLPAVYESRGAEVLVTEVLGETCWLELGSTTFMLLSSGGRSDRTFLVESFMKRFDDVDRYCVLRNLGRACDWWENTMR